MEATQVSRDGVRNCRKQGVRCVRLSSSSPKASTYFSLARISPLNSEMNNEQQQQGRLSNRFYVLRNSLKRPPPNSAWHSGRGS
jgi:hypothetical protein